MPRVPVVSSSQLLASFLHSDLFFGRLAGKPSGYKRHTDKYTQKLPTWKWEGTRRIDQGVCFSVASLLELKCKKARCGLPLGLTIIFKVFL